MKNLLLYFILIPATSFAEYRVYQYTVQNLVSNAADAPKANIVVSTLDPVAYVAYNGGSRLVQVDLLRTWICPGHTGNAKNICPSPYAQIVSQNPNEER